MNLNIATTQIKSLKEKAVNEVDQNFNQYLFTELTETGDTDYFLIDSNSWWLYWLDLLADLKPIMDFLLEELEIANNREEVTSRIMDCIELKRIIDAKIIEYDISSQREQQINYNEIFNYIGLSNNAQKSSIKYISLNNLSVIPSLHKGLSKGFDFIDNTLEEFSKHFYPGPFIPIIWKSTLTNLIILIQFLCHYKILPPVYNLPKSKIRMVLTHFRNSNNTYFNLSSIKSTFSIYKDPSKIKNSPELQAFVVGL